MDTAHIISACNKAAAELEAIIQANTLSVLDSILFDKNYEPLTLEFHNFQSMVKAAIAELGHQCASLDISDSVVEGMTLDDYRKTIAILTFSQHPQEVKAVRKGDFLATSRAIQTHDNEAYKVFMSTMVG